MIARGCGRLLIVYSALVAVAGLALTRSSGALPATQWCYIYHPSDFPTLRDLGSFLWNLRVPIPPVVSALEILNYQATGTTRVVTVVLYRLSMVLSFIVAMILASSSVKRLTVSFLLSVVFLWSTVLIHPGNPQVYDVFFPLLTLLFVLFLKLGAGVDRRGYIWCFLAGLSLAMAELMRPFVLMLLVVAIPAVWYCLKMVVGGTLTPALSRGEREGDRSEVSPITRFLAFLVPVLLISGLWHAHLMVSFRQITMSNHAGFNLRSVWDMAELPELVEEVNIGPVKPGRWDNINTPEHSENSRRVRKAIVRYVVTHPVRSCITAAQRMISFAGGTTSIYKHHPVHPVLLFYRPMVTMFLGILFLNMLVLSVVALRGKVGIPAILASPENALIMMLSATVAILAVGEVAEEARLLVSVLPLVAAMPMARMTAGGNLLTPGMPAWAFIAAGAAVPLMTLTAELLAAGRVVVGRDQGTVLLLGAALVLYGLRASETARFMEHEG